MHIHATECHKHTVVVINSRHGDFSSRFLGHPGMFALQREFPSYRWAIHSPSWGKHGCTGRRCLCVGWRNVVVAPSTHAEDPKVEEERRSRLDAGRSGDMVAWYTNILAHEAEALDGPWDRVILGGVGVGVGASFAAIVLANLDILSSGAAGSKETR